MHWYNDFWDEIFISYVKISLWNYTRNCCLWPQMLDVVKKKKTKKSATILNFNKTAMRFYWKGEIIRAIFGHREWLNNKNYFHVRLKTCLCCLLLTLFCKASRWLKKRFFAGCKVVSDAILLKTSRLRLRFRRSNSVSKSFQKLSSISAKKCFQLDIELSQWPFPSSQPQRVQNDVRDFFSV